MSWSALMFKSILVSKTVESYHCMLHAHWTWCCVFHLIFLKECECRFCSCSVPCLPGAVEESHSCGAAPGHGWWMEPKGGAAVAVTPSLVAIITVMMRTEETDTVIQGHRGNGVTDADFHQCSPFCAAEMTNKLQSSCRNGSVLLWFLLNAANELFVRQIKKQSSAASSKWSGQIAPIRATCTQMQKCCDC